jgi:hypothetical protein
VQERQRLRCGSNGAKAAAGLRLCGWLPCSLSLVPPLRWLLLLLLLLYDRRVDGSVTWAVSSSTRVHSSWVSAGHVLSICSDVQQTIKTHCTGAGVMSEQVSDMHAGQWMLQPMCFHDVDHGTKTHCTSP